MPAFLMIQNPGVAMKEAFTLLGASTKRGADNRTIGQFGSGNKHGVAVCLRNHLDPVIFAGNLRMNFGTRPQNVNDGLKETQFSRVFVKYSGKEGDKSLTSTEDLGFVLEYGASDWLGVDLALREFVSNAIDRAIAEGEETFVQNWFKNGKDINDEFVKSEARQALSEYRKTATDYKNVVVEIANENQVRAKSGHTRVFVPLSEEVTKFYNNLGKWFLHFSEPENLDTPILPKKNRNIGNRTAAVIYRKGVRVREFESSDVPSLFDYNLANLKMDESRKVDDWHVMNGAARALRDADATTLAKLLNSFSGTAMWEHGFDHYGLNTDYSDTDVILTKRKETWQKAFTAVGGEDGVMATAGNGELAARKGYKVISAPEAFVKAAGTYGVRTPEKVLSQDDRDGREIVDALPDAESALDFCWDVVTSSGLTNGKERPKVKCFRKIMSGGGQTLGFYRDGVVYVNTDIAGYSSVQTGYNALSQQLLATMMEEVAHYVTGATDNSRDFQDYVLNLAVCLAKKQAGI